ncbi:cyclic 2,3-diphosphoglycerate synthase [Nitrospira sp. Kam-Ns4a]
MDRIKVLILGAAGRAFHNFNVVFRDDPRYEVVAFTAAQIPAIAGRRYPPSLAGPLYPEGIPILPQAECDALLERERIAQVVFAYSDVAHEEVMHVASRALARGADFRVLGPHATMLTAAKPVISVCAVRTGCGKSPVTRKAAALLREAGLRVAIVRHPMPYGNLERQAVQRFATLEDLRAADCTIEEMEEYEPHLVRGDVVYVGVDYARVLRLAEADADVILWDGGNNEFAFFEPALEIVLLDPHRAGHERAYFPGEVNLLRADVLVLTKLDTADPARAEAVRRAARAANPCAIVIESAMPLSVDAPGLLRGARVLVIEDGPTLTQGGMGYGAGLLAALRYGAREFVDPRPSAVGSIARVFADHPHLGAVLPAMGYGPAQLAELEQTIHRVDCDLVVIATPVDLRRLITIPQATCRVTYEFEEIGAPTLREALAGVMRKAMVRG